MATHVALLGGINVGGHRVTMARLRDEVASLGHADVSTFIASGNVLLTPLVRLAPAAIEARIAEHLAQALGWPVPTFLRGANDIIEAAELQPFGAVGEGYTHMVAFCREAPSGDVEQASTDIDRFHVRGREVHWLIQGGVSTSAMTLPKLAKLIGPNTTRNVTTIKKLAALLHRSDD